MSKYNSSILLALSIFIASTFIALQVLAASTDVCPQTDGWNKQDNINNNSYTYNAPSNSLITESCYKAGTTLIFATYNPPVASITLNSTVWNKAECPNTNGCNYQAISHASFKTTTVSPTPTLTPTNTPMPTVSLTPTVAPTVTPTPTDVATPTPTVTPSFTPTPTCSGNLCVDIDCDGEGECEVEIGASPTPTVTTTPEPTPTVTPTITPGPTSTPGPGPTSTPGPGPTATPEPARGGEVAGATTEGKVLGATSLASTGGAPEAILNLSGLLGFILTAVSVPLYGKRSR